MFVYLSSSCNPYDGNAFKFKRPHVIDVMFVCQYNGATGSETWAKNWTSLLSTKSSEGAYSWLKVFVSATDGTVAFDLEKTETETSDAAAAGHNDAGAGDGVEEKDDKGKESKEAEDGSTKNIRSKMTLQQLALCGMSSLVENSPEYKRLFGDDKSNVSAVDIKLLELRLELFLWDWVCRVSLHFCF